MSQMPSLRFRSPILVIAIAAGVILGWGERPLRAEERTRTRGQESARYAAQRRTRPLRQNPFVVLGYNDLGMHCMNQDFSQLCILPPFNNLHAQVIDRRGEEPRIASSGDLRLVLDSGQYDLDHTRRISGAMHRHCSACPCDRILA